MLIHNANTFKEDLSISMEAKKGNEEQDKERKLLSEGIRNEDTEAADIRLARGIAEAP